ncbi:aspartate aminotransferase family protein [Conexibacter sp. DBS9H8]|uniref:aminotransferase family protein n=1 Tax=Conexibacter sp. DBS9H8 TaxID=2937801 RepID=UPI00200F4E09|nr:aminotransferase class III-fold pyridoxal phosphate-dependent enzyme [Conexibacter sp. DBS9H8]
MTDTKFWHPFAAMGSVRSSELVIDHGEDVWVWDEQGNRYLDGTAALWYAMVGHGRREIAEAIAAQAAKLESYSTFGDFSNRPAITLCERLVDLAPGDDWRVFLTSGGGDSVDTALKLARRFFAARGEADRLHVISRSAGYHGTHGWGTAASGIPANREGFGPPVAETTQVPRDSLEALEAAFQEIGPERVAAVISEPVIGAGGLYPPLPGYLQGVQELCHRYGALFIVDAVICGFGRLGSWYGFERLGLDPDMVTFAKGVTSGYLPLGGVLISEAVAEPFFASDGPIFRHGATYAGHPTCAAAALANLEILGREHLLDRARELEGPLFAAMSSLTEHPLVSEARGGLGFLAAIDLREEARTERPTVVAEVFHAARERGLIVRPLATGLAVSPPLTASTAHIDLIVETLATSLDAVAEAAQLSLDPS